LRRQPPLTAIIIALLVPLAALAARKHDDDVSTGISCPHDRTVRVTTNTGINHLPGKRWYGRTKSWTI
jgi:hypothetical protein